MANLGLIPQGKGCPTCTVPLTQLNKKKKRRRRRKSWKFITEANKRDLSLIFAVTEQIEVRRFSAYPGPALS